MSLDEMGFQYYSHANNTTMTNTIYHFNYAISLITGIFDSLALIAKDKLRLQFKDDNIPERTSLNPRAGKEFLKALGKKNAPLRKHINQHVLFIKLITGLREKVVHREMLEETGFEHANEKWKANLFKVDDQTHKLIQQCGDGSHAYEPFTRWGRYSMSTYRFLEPYHFMESAFRTLVGFGGKFLELLGYANCLEEVAAAGPSDFLENLRLFRGKGLRDYS